MKNNQNLYGFFGNQRTLVLWVFLLFAQTSKGQSWTEIIKTFPEGTENAAYGYSVDVDGEYAVVGSFKSDEGKGSAYVLTYADNKWEDIAKLSASDGQEEDYFGISVAISGEVVVVGAYYDNGKGAGYVFEKPEDGWADMTETAKLTASDGDASHYFGRSVSIFEQTIVVGAPANDNAGELQGAAYVFEEPLGGWQNMTETAKLTAQDGEAYDHFGIGVDIYDETIVVGTYRYLIGNGDDNKGTAYVFKKPDDGWVDMTETHALLAADGEDYDFFGYAVSISDNTIAIGAFGYDDNKGAVYVYDDYNSWTDESPIVQTAKLTASDGMSSDWFGISVSIDNNVMVIGAMGDDDDTGASYVFDKPESGWTDMQETKKLIASDGGAEDNFGRSVAISGTHIAIGADETGATYFWEWLEDGAIIFHELSDAIYGDEARVLIATASSEEEIHFTSSNENVAILSGGLLTITGAGETVITASQEGNDLQVSQTLTVEKKELTLSIDDKYMTYGEEIPVLSGNLSGLVNEDNFTSSFYTTDAQEAGSFFIYGSVDDADNKLVNYSISSTLGILTIAKAPLIIIANDVEVNEGGVLPPLTYTYSGFVNEENESILDVLPTISTASDAGVEGTYPILLSGGEDNNYAFSFREGTLTVLGMTDNILSAGIRPDDVVVFPNPVTSWLNVKSDQIKRLSVLDLNGKVLIQKEEKNAIAVNELKTGIYLLYIEDFAGSMVAYRFHKQ